VAADDPLKPITVYTGGANASWVEVPIVREDSQD
jgi:hypothetical protein